MQNGTPSSEASGTGGPMVGLIMGSQSDWETMEHTAELLAELGISFEKRVVSAHRTPELMHEYAGGAADRGLQVIIAGAGGAAHLPGMTAGMTHLPVIGVPVQSKALNGMDSLLSIVQMPPGIPVATMAIGRPGAINAALLAARIIGLHNREVSTAVIRHKDAQRDAVLAQPTPGETS